MTDLIRQFAFRPEGSKVTHKVRTVTREGEPWFVLADVCSVLEIANAGNVSARLDDDEKATIHNADSRAGAGAQSFTIVNESGLWSLVLTSRKPEAKAFKKWLTSVVIPSLRKHGGYIVGQERMNDVKIMAAGMAAANRIAAKERQKRLAAASSFRPSVRPAPTSSPRRSWLRQRPSNRGISGRYRNITFM